jgi:DNA mismatch endonuclease (patch repair protein)
VSDTLSPSERSSKMARVRRTGTKPERMLHGVMRSALGYRRKLILDAADVVGRPDLVVPSLRLAVFAHGCFWHSCPIHGRIPKSHRDFWVPKLKANVRRDRAVVRKLRQVGWSVWIVWEHDLIAGRIQAISARLFRRAERLKSSRRKAP